MTGSAPSRLPMHEFVAGLVREVAPDARLVEFVKVSRHYTVRLEIPAVGKTLSLPGRLIDTALVNPGSRKALRSLLRSAALALRAERAIADSRETLTNTSTDPVCPVCRNAIRRGSPAAVRMGALLHRDCTEDT